MGRHRRKRAVYEPAQQAVNTASEGAASAGTVSEAGRSYNRARMFVLIFAIVAAVAIVGMLLFSLIDSIIKSEKLDYKNDDLSKYIFLSPNDYKYYTVSAKVTCFFSPAPVNSILEKWQCMYFATSSPSSVPTRSNT